MIARSWVRAPERSGATTVVLHDGYSVGRTPGTERTRHWIQGKSGRTRRQIQGTSRRTRRQIQGKSGRTRRQIQGTSERTSH